MEAADARQFFDFATQAPKLPSSQAPKLPSSLAIAGTLGVLLVLVFVFESMQISATNDSPKTHAELTEVEESVIQGAYQILASLDIPVHFSDLRTAKIMPGPLADQVRDLVLRFEPALAVHKIELGDSRDFFPVGMCLAAFRSDGSGVLSKSDGGSRSVVLASGQRRRFIIGEWNCVIAFKVGAPLLNVKSIFQRRVVDFGCVTTGTVVNVQVPLQNTRSTLVTLGVGPVPCGCISPTIDTEELSPGDAATYEIKFDTSGKAGWIEYDLPVSVCFLGSTITETVRISGRVVESQYLSSTEFSIGVRNLTDRVSRTVKCGDGTAFFSIDNVVCEPGLRCTETIVEEERLDRELIFTLECVELGLGRHYVAADVKYTAANGEASQDKVTFSVDIIPELK